MKNLDIRQLKYFSEVVKHKSITKAAETLHISQPALSKMIKGLEDELGMTLIVRTNKTSNVTDAGLIVMEYAKRINSLFEEMETTLHDMTNLNKGSIHIGLPPIIGSLYFPKVIAEFHTKYPNIEIHIQEYGAAKVVKSVDEGEFELGVAVLPVDHQQFNIYPIVQDEMKLLVHFQHRLAHSQTVHISELKDEDIIFYHEDFALHDIMWEKFIEIGFEPKVLFKSSQWDFMSEMVAAKLGITILPDSICNRVQNEKVKIIDLIPSTPWNLAIITKKGRYISNAARRLIDFIV